MTDGDAVELLGAHRDRTRVYAAMRERQEQTRDAADGVRAQFAERFALYRTALASAALADPAFGQPTAGTTASNSTGSGASSVAAWASRLLSEATAGSSSSSSSTAADELLGPRAATDTRGACARCGTAFGWRVAARECPCCGACYCPRCYGTATTRVVLDNSTSSGNSGGNSGDGTARTVEVRVCAACAAAVGRSQARAAFAARRARAEHDPLALLCCDVTTYMDMADRRIARVEALLPRVGAPGTPEFREAQETLDAARGVVGRIQGALAAVAQMARSTPSHTRLRVLANFKAFTLQYLQASATPRLVRLQNALVQAAKAPPQPQPQPQKQPQPQQPQTASPQPQVRMPRPEITSVAPAVVPLGGGPVCVAGTHFHERCTVTVAGRRCAVTARRALAGDAQELHIVAPPAPAGQQVAAVRVTNPNGDTASMGGLLYVADAMLSPPPPQQSRQQQSRPQQQQQRAVRQPRLVLEGVVPAVCALSGGDVRLLGGGFQAGMQVLLDRTPLADVVVLPEGTEALLAVPPMRHSGVHDLTARNPDGTTATLKGVLYTLADVASCPGTMAPQPQPRRTPQAPQQSQSQMAGTGQGALGPAVLVDHFEASNPHSRKWG